MKQFIVKALQVFIVVILIINGDETDGWLSWANYIMGGLFGVGTLSLLYKDMSQANWTN